MTMTEHNPVVSIIMPVFNGQKYLEEAIESILAQTYGEYELLIIDDGSQDDSYAMVQKFAQEQPELIRLITHPLHRNKGVAPSRNAALKQARGKYVAFLDQDDYWHKDKLKIQVAFMDEHPDVALSYTQAGILRAGDGENFTPGLDVLGDEPPTEFLSAFFKIILIELNYIFSAVMMHTDLLRKLGGLPENLPFQSDDRIMVAQVSMDHAIALVPEKLCFFRAHDEHYTANVIRSGIGPMLIFDLQVRLIKWLIQNAHHEVAEYTTYYILPRTYADALVFLRSVSLRKLFSQIFRGRKTPNNKRVVQWLLRCLGYRFSWQWMDPQTNLLHQVRKNSCWLGRHQLENQINQRDYSIQGDGRKRARNIPRVSIIMVTKNDNQFIGDTVESILAQTCSDLEILLLDNHSTDASAQIAEAYANDPAGRFVALTLPPGQRTNASHACNLAVNIARGEFITFVRAGDYWPPDKLEQLIQYMEKRPATSLCLYNAWETFLPQQQNNEPQSKSSGAPPAAENLPAWRVLETTRSFALNTTFFRKTAFHAHRKFSEKWPHDAAAALLAADICTESGTDSLGTSFGKYRCEPKGPLDAIRLLRLQTAAVCELLRIKKRAQAIDIAARLLPGTIRKNLFPFKKGHILSIGRNLLRLFIRLPHWPLIVLRFRAAQRREKRKKDRAE